MNRLAIPLERGVAPIAIKPKTRIILENIVLEENERRGIIHVRLG